MQGPNLQQFISADLHEKCGRRRKELDKYHNFIFVFLKLSFDDFLTSERNKKGTEKELEFLPQISFSSSFLSKGTSSSYSSPKRN